MPDADENAADTLPGRPRRRLLTAPTVTLFALVVGVGGFLIGVQVQKDNSGASQSSAAGGGGAGGGGGRLRALLAAGDGGGSSASTDTSGGAGGGRRGVGGGSAGSLTLGQVASVDSSTLYVTTAQGGTVAVHTTPSSQVTRTVDSSARAVHPGEQVVIQGTKNADGSIQAATVASNATPAGALGSAAALGGTGGGGGRGGSGGGAGGGSGGGAGGAGAVAIPRGAVGGP
ncbi:MAG: hypothetical protein ACR2ND_09570 [Solirubrobacteraceae bacterium]